MNNKKIEQKRIQTFDKSYAANIFFKIPDNYTELENFSKLSEKIISTGANYSYSPIGFSEKSLSFDLKKFNRIIDFDSKKKEITVEAGVTINDFLNYLLKKNLWIPQIPGYPFITLGGAVAANIHGKSCGVDGTIRNSIKSIVIFHKKNGWLTLSNVMNKEIFDLTIGGLGLTGTIVKITFKLADLHSSNFTTTRFKVYDVKECLKVIKKNATDDAFIYSWNRADDIKEFGEGFVFKNKKNINSGDAQKKNLNIKKNMRITPPFSLWNRITIKLANKIYQKLISYKKESTTEDFKDVIFPFAGKEIYFDFFGKHGFIESQLLIAEDKLIPFFEEFNYLYKLHSPTITLFSFKSMSGAQKFLRFEDNKICVTFDFINNKNNLIFLKELDKICIKYKILPSIIKDSRISKKTFLSCYNDAETFKKKLTEFDKDRIYVSELSDRFGI